MRKTDYKMLLQTHKVNPSHRIFKKLKDGDYAYHFFILAFSYFKERKKPEDIPEDILQAISIYSSYNKNLIERMLQNGVGIESIPQILLDNLDNFVDLIDIMITLIKEDKEIPDSLIDVIVKKHKDFSRAEKNRMILLFQYFVVHSTEVPKKLKNLILSDPDLIYQVVKTTLSDAAYYDVSIKYDFTKNPFFHELLDKFAEGGVNDKVHLMKVHDTLIKMMNIKVFKNLPPNLLNRLATSPQHSLSLLMYIFRDHGLRDAPEVLINSVAKDPSYSKSLLQLMKRLSLNIPDNIRKSAEQAPDNRNVFESFFHELSQ